MKGSFFIFTLLILLACSDGKVDTSKVQAEMKAREVKVIPEAKILERAFELGDSLLSTLDPSIGLSKTSGVFHHWDIEDIGIDCSIYFLKTFYNMEEKEKQVFDAYRYSAKNKQKAEPNIQRLPGEIMVYNAPFMEEDQLKGMWSIKLPRKYIILSIEE
ncbi:MAG: hypothetical protein HEP71_23370 [Roseivirga sp.]|nr:hypothetical protein [Roseivirga sp.]